MGDPQAPFDTVLGVLRYHRLLDGDRLRGDVQLVSMGDHFDFGAPAQRAQATADGTRLVEWLASHSADQAVMLLGNHDLARLCELAAFSDDAAFEAAFAQADAAYRHGGDEAAFRARYPHVPDAESIARDFSCFEVKQRALVQQLMNEGRFKVAHAHGELLLVHAGVTQADFTRIGAAPQSAQEAASALNAADLKLLHQPGSAATGSGRGVFFHRPAVPHDSADFTGLLRRRFDPRELPPQFSQAIGHIRDKKCHELLGAWVRDSAPMDGPIRSLNIDGEAVRYARGTSPDARLYFLDGGMAHTAPENYELFDLDTREPWRP